mmetsp:Transcript_18148/g.51678  ORF Transcript_18148/g.51678 Transcript_18148/m.51678 type:complete len:1054 (+) Transcript_18148:126-3287(+)
MTKITQIEDRSATTAWCPIRSHADVIALGTKDSGGGGFDDTGGELDLYDLNVAQSKEGPKMLGSVKCTSRFASLGWALPTAKIGNGKYDMGLIAGGMENGSVHVWNPKGVMSNQPSIVASYSKHSSGPVKALRFNTLDPTLLATGGSDGQVYIANLEPLDKPVISAPAADKSQSAQITSLAWNTQVAHIVASASGDGTVAVWDLKGQKAWCELRETTGHAISDVAWNPSQGLHLLTAIADDRNPVLKLWDLRASTSMPLATLTGHQQGILSMAWCPHDEHLLLSCGKDNRTILWDLYTLKPIAEVPNDTPASQDMGNASSTELFGASGLASSQQRRYDVQWSPVKRGVASTCSLDRKVQAHSILGLASQCGRPPKWLRPSSSASFGFGGAVVSCGAVDKIVRCQTVVEQPDLVNISKSFEAEMAATTPIDFCATQSVKCKDPKDAEIWGFMQVIFETNARQQLLGHLGFHPDAISKAAAEYKEDPTSNGVANMSLSDAKGAMSEAAKETVKNALLVGDFQAAVDCCFETGNLADALVLASCGGGELWANTQTRFFEREASKRPYLSIVSAIIHSQLEELIQESNPQKWKETLAILSTYSKSEDFPTLCISLGDLLEKNGDAKSASLCFMCALSLDRAIAFWRQQLKEADDKKGSHDLLALHKFVIKVSIFLQAVGSSAVLSQDADLFALYASRLSEQGLLETAAKYARGESASIKVLKDRLYRSRASPACLAAMGGTPPDFPFTMVDVKVSRQPTISKQQQRVAQLQQQQQYQQQQAQQQAQQEQQQQAQAAQAQAQAQSQAAYQQTAQANNTQAAPASDALPAGWAAYQDPTTGSTYYANQATGETSWERPQAAPAARAATPTQQMQQPSAAAASTPSTNTKMASKYGDGFVTSASHPELASQYGNVGTSDPYANTSRPGTARVAAVEKPPVSGTLHPDRIGQLADDYIPMQDMLLSLVDALKNTQLSAGDKRQLAEAEKGVAVFLKRLARGDVPTDVAGKMMTMTTSIQSYDWRSAQSIQTGLVSTDWKEHKDWLKGIKALLQLSSKKFRT